MCCIHIYVCMHVCIHIYKYVCVYEDHATTGKSDLINSGRR